MATSDQNPAALEAAATFTARLTSRALRPLIKRRIGNTLDAFGATEPTQIDILVRAWSNPARKQVFLTSVDGVFSLIQGLVAKGAAKLGTFGVFLEEAAELVGKDGPEALSDYMDHRLAAQKEQLSTVPPSNDEIKAAGAKLGEFLKQKLPTAVMFKKPLNSAKWSKEVSERFQQALDAFGPIGISLMLEFWRSCTATQRKELKYHLRALDTPEEIESFLGLPTDDERRDYLGFIAEVSSLDLPISPQTRAMLWREWLKVRAHYNRKITPWLKDRWQELRSTNGQLEAKLKQPGEFYRSPQVIYSRSWLWPLSIAAGIIVLAVLTVAISNTRHPVPASSSAVSWMSADSTSHKR